MPLADQVTLLATRAATEIKSVRAARGPIGAISTAAITTAASPDATAGVLFRYTATGNPTIAVPTGGVDGQHMLFEVLASGAARTVTFNSAYEISQAVPGRVFTIPSATWGYFAAVCRAGTWRLVSAEPQATITVPTLPSNGLWMPGDNGLLGWTMDPINVSNAASIPSGFLHGAMLRLDTQVTVSNILCYVNTPGVGLVASRSYAGLYNSAGTLVASTADQSTGWASTGTKVMPVVTPVVCPAGLYYVGVISQAATTVVAMAAMPIYGFVNQGRSIAAWRASRTDTTYNSLPTPRPSANTLISLMWFALS